MNKKHAFTFILALAISASMQAKEQTLVEKAMETFKVEVVKSWLFGIKDSVVSRYNGAIKLLPSPTQAYGRTIYVCGSDDCDFCFESHNNSLLHTVKCHFLKETTVKERFEEYPRDDGALKLAFSKNIEDSPGASALKSMALSFVNAMGVEAVEALFED